MQTQTKDLTNRKQSTFQQMIIRQLLDQNVQAFSSSVPTNKDALLLQQTAMLLDTNMLTIHLQLCPKK